MAIARPGKIVCVGRNYREHAAELGNVVPERPLLFFKPATAVIGDGDTIVLPPESTRVEYEAEIALVIGRHIRRATEAQALAALAGSERQRGYARDMVFGPAALVAFISQAMTLEPGDVIATGTPAGVGPLVAGDVVEVEIPGVGVLRNPVSAEPSSSTTAR